jgi:hypothetical protein
LVLWCESDWSLRDYWDQEFATLLNSLRPIDNGNPESKQDGELIRNSDK